MLEIFARRTIRYPCSQGWYAYLEERPQPRDYTGQEGYTTEEPPDATWNNLNLQKAPHSSRSIAYAVGSPVGTQEGESGLRRVPEG